MGAPDKIAANAREHLRPGEVVQASFPGQDTVGGRVGTSFSAVVVTDQRILLFGSGMFTQTKLKTLRAELPRATTIGPAKGLWHRMPEEFGKLYVNFRFFKQIVAADAALG